MKLNKLSRVFIVLFGIFMVFVFLLLINQHDSSKDNAVVSRIGSNRKYEQYKEGLKQPVIQKTLPLQSSILRQVAHTATYNIVAKQTPKTGLHELNNIKSVKTTTLKSSLEFEDIVGWPQKDKTKQTAKHNKVSPELLRYYVLNTSILVLKQDHVVRNCVTGDKIAEAEQNILVRPLSLDVNRDGYVESSQSRLHSFEDVFKSRAWGHDWDSSHKGLNASGRGATIYWAQETMATLHTTINNIKQQYNLEEVRLLDIPCGDMAWMSRFLKTRDDIIYTGMDIVPDLITHHKKMYKGYKKWTFINADVVDDETTLHHYDIILCRTMLQHLYNYDILKLLGKFSKSGSQFLLLSTFANHDQNTELLIDIANPGRFRKLNMQLPPFSLTAPLCLHRDGPPEIREGLEHFLGLWKLPLKQIENCRVKKVKPVKIPLDIFGCNISD